MNSLIKVAFMGAKHPHIFPRLTLCKQTEEIEITGIYDPDQQLSFDISEKYNINHATSIDELFPNGAVDLVIIEGHEPENPAYVLHALGRTRMLLIEKPGAPTIATMQKMVESIEEAGVHAQLGYMYNYSPIIEKVRKLLANGILGHITLARFHAGAPVGCAAEIWQSVPGDMGGVLFTDGCHMLAAVVRLMGAPISVKGQILKIQNGKEVTADIYKEDTLSGLGSEKKLKLGEQLFEDAGAGILLYEDKIATFDVTGWEAHNWVEAWSMEFFGTNGTMQVKLVPPGFNLWVRQAIEGYDRGWHTWQGSETAEGIGASLVVDENYRNELTDILKRLRNDLAPDYTALREGLEVVKIADAIYRTSD